MKKHMCAILIGGLLLTSRDGVAADSNNGKILADRWCAACHVTNPGQRVTSEAPPFATVANKENLDAAKLAHFLLHPHPVMPDMGLTRSEAADLAAYIMSLRAAK